MAAGAAKEESTKEGARQRLALKDSLSLLFSALALMISAAGYYVANVRIQDAVIARITDFGLDPNTPADPASRHRNGLLVFKVAFINTGNRQAIIDRPVYQLSHRADLEDGGFGAEVDGEGDTFPFVLAPKEIRLVPLRIPISRLLLSLEDGQPIPPSPDQSETLRRFFAGFRYSAIDSAGRPHLADSGMQVEIDMSARGWVGMRPAPDVASRSELAFPATNLFRGSTR